MSNVTQRDWSPVISDMQRAGAPQAEVIHNMNQKIDVGGINVHITQPGATASDVHRAVMNGVRSALEFQTRVDLPQLSAAW
jgi:hypothetical protein